MTARSTTLIQSRWGFIIFMSVMCSLSPFAMSFLVPAFPNMAVQFGKPVADIQFLISVFLIGLGVSQPIHGIVSDRIGRRPVLIFGFSIFVLASIASVITTSWNALVLCRFLQAVGVSAGTVISRAIVNDVQPREEAAISLSYISIAMGVGPIIAPIFGSILDDTFGWRSIFAACAITGIIIWLMAVMRLPETKPADTEPRDLITDYKHLLSNTQFIGYTLMFGFGQGVFFAYLPFAPDYFENVLGLGTSIFVTSWIALSLAFMAGSLLGTRLTRRIGMDGAILGASLWLIGAMAIMATTYLVWGDNVVAVTASIMLAMVGTGLICPLALAGSISTNAKLGATAAGLSSSLGLILGGLFSVFAGKLYDQTLWPYLALAAFAIVGNLLAVGLTRRGRII
ncbi:multidrug effflux MFS transporter [Fretibacter rubidus]|uniref:multidrug effflux MFS transporter n=1 Tax=Fretibacter rubidus TaxID=570162 RepID=UPI003529E443